MCTIIACGTQEKTWHECPVVALLSKMALYILSAWRYNYAVDTQRRTLGDSEEPSVQRVEVLGENVKCVGVTPDFPRDGKGCEHCPRPL